MLLDILEWLREHATLLWWLGLGSAVTFAGSLLMIPVLIARLPVDYFTTSRRRPSGWGRQHPALWTSLAVLRNVVGGLVVLAGIAMLLLPGQGLLAILVGLTLIDFPGRTRLLRSLVRKRPVARALNWIRARVGRPPLEIPETVPSGTGDRPERHSP
jgi:Putative transmembrane protein (PGPGW)